MGLGQSSGNPLFLRQPRCSAFLLLFRPWLWVVCTVPPSRITHLHTAGQRTLYLPHLHRITGQQDYMSSWAPSLSQSGEPSRDLSVSVPALISVLFLEGAVSSKTPCNRRSRLEIMSPKDWIIQVKKSTSVKQRHAPDLFICSKHLHVSRDQTYAGPVYSLSQQGSFPTTNHAFLHFLQHCEVLC